MQKLLSGPKNGTTFDHVRSNWRPNQQIAISRGINDSGIFELNFHDERYLPFEGTGAISDWNLSLPKAANRTLDFDSISDVIIHLQYTALDGGEEFRGAVTGQDLVKNFQGYRLVSLANDFPAVWRKFKGAWQTPGTIPDVSFSLSTLVFPLNATPTDVKMLYAEILPGGALLTLTPDQKADRTQVNEMQFQAPLTLSGAMAGRSVDDVTDILIIFGYTIDLTWDSGSLA
jgi:hypothetical protein